MPADQDKILKEVKSGKYAPVYFLQGEETFFIDQISDYIEKNCLNETEKGFNQTVLYGKDVNMTTILTNARRFPMMSERQVVIVKEAQELSDLGKEQGDKMLEAYVKNPLPSTVLVFCHKYKSLDGRKGIVKLLDKHAVLVTTKKLYDNQLPDWITKHFQNLGYKISPKAAVMIAENIGNDLSRIANEASKLLLNVKEGQDVNEDLVERYVGISKEFNAFELQKSLVARDILKANKIVNYFDANPKNNPVIPIIILLFSLFTKVLLVHSSKERAEKELAALLQVHPFFVKDYITAARAYPVQKVVHIIGYLREADLKLKGVNNVSATEGQILKELVFKILH